MEICVFELQFSSLEAPSLHQEPPTPNHWSLPLPFSLAYLSTAGVVYSVAPDLHTTYLGRAQCLLPFRRGNTARKCYCSDALVRGFLGLHSLMALVAFKSQGWELVSHLFFNPPESYRTEVNAGSIYLGSEN